MVLIEKEKYRTMMGKGGKIKIENNLLSVH